MVPIPIQVAPHTVVSGQMTCRTAMALKIGLMDLLLRASFRKVRSMDGAASCGGMAACTRVSLNATTCMVRGHMPGMMVECILDNGIVTTWAQVGQCSGQMAECMRGTSMRVASMEWAHIGGPMEGHTEGSGGVASSMVQALLEL